MMANRHRLLLPLLFGSMWACASSPDAGEQELATYLGPPRLEIQGVFEDERFPCITVARDGTVVATWGSTRIQARRSTDGGATFGPAITIADPGFQGGGLTVDEGSGDILAFVEEHHPPAPLSVYRSRDSGETWSLEEVVLHPDPDGNVPSMHMNESGITLVHGEHAGRLLRPARWYAGGNRESEWPRHYTNAIFSDDGGSEWRTSAPFPERGTGEATLAELEDGRIYYNSRVHWPEAARPMRRHSAWSHDGGETWTDWAVVEVLPDGRQDRAYGCMGGLVRLPVPGHDILVFSNIDTPRARRERATVWASFDGGETWPLKRLVFEGPSGYSSLAAGRPGTASEGWIYLMFEGGPEGGAAVARFNLAWILDGEPTGDGVPPIF